MPPRAGECSYSVCEQVYCANGGVCFPNRADGYICLCPLGFRGALCEERKPTMSFSFSALQCFSTVDRWESMQWGFMFLVSVSIPPGFSLSSPLFNETVFSYAVVPWPQSSQSYLSFMEFEVTFCPSLPDGTLLYSDDAGSGDFLAINLVDRYVEFRFDCGSGGATIRFQKINFTLISISFTSAENILKRWFVLFLRCRSVEQISMDAWHELRVSRTAKSAILQVDSQTPVEGIAEVFLSSLVSFGVSEAGYSSGSMCHVPQPLSLSTGKHSCESE